MAKLIHLPGARPVNEGERVVVSYLVEKLPGTYTLIPNAEIIEHGGPAFEYDVIVIGPYAVYVVEIKRWCGGINGDDHSWIIAGQHRRPNPWSTVNNKARVLKSQLQRRLPILSEFWVEAVVAIADNQVELNLRGACRNHTFRYTDLPIFLKDSKTLGEKAGNIAPLRSKIENAIQELARGRRIGRQRFGDYEVQETLAIRETFTEYLARNILLRTADPVRLRVFRYNPYLRPNELAQQLESIRHEAEALQKIGPHPNLIALQSFLTAPEDPNLFVEVTEWSEEGTLRNLLYTSTPLTLERKLELAHGIAAGLRAAHNAEVIHRDVRPENILIGRNGQPRLMNFDHARLSIPGVQTVGPRKPEVGISQAYLAPELLNPAQSPTPAADIYGLGIIIFEMIVGDVPYDTPEAALAFRTSAGGPADYGVVDLPTRLNDLVRHLIHPDPARRPQSADIVINELQALNQPSGIVLNLTPTPEQEVQEVTSSEDDPMIFQKGQLIDGKYQVLKALSPGGWGVVYKVFDINFERVYAVKVFNDPNLAAGFLRKEACALLEINHPNIVRIWTWGRLCHRSSENV